VEPFHQPLTLVRIVVEYVIDFKLPQPLLSELVPRLFMVVLEDLLQKVFYGL
jgi:hypothetical protein